MLGIVTDLLQFSNKSSSYFGKRALYYSGLTYPYSYLKNGFLGMEDGGAAFHTQKSCMSCDFEKAMNISGLPFDKLRNLFYSTNTY